MESFKFSGMTIPELEEQLRQRDAQIKAQAAQLEEQAKRIEELEKANAELRKLFADMARAKESKPPKEAMNYGVGRHEHKQRKKRRREGCQTHSFPGKARSNRGYWGNTLSSSLRT